MARIWRHQPDSINIHHVGMEVAYLDKGLLFFEKVLGFTQTDRFQFAGEKIVILQKDGFKLELVQPVNPTLEKSEFHIAVCIDDLEEVRNTCIQYEWEEPVTYPNGWTSAFMKVSPQLYIEWLKVK